MFQNAHNKLAEYTEYKKACKRTVSQAADDSSTSTSSSASKRPRLSGDGQLTLHRRTESFPCISQAAVDDLIINYIVDEVRPLSTVEKPSFRAIIHGLSPTHTVMCRKTLTKKLGDKHKALLFDIKQQVIGQPAVCTTTDIWSCMRKSYIGLTAHWITDDLKRRSVALACSRVKGSHTYDIIAEHIMNIHADFGLDHSNITFTVTDNGANVVKAFKEYQEIELGEGPSDDLDDLEDGINEVMSVDVDNILSEPDDSNDVFLPKHMRCASHTLSLLARNDFLKILASDTGTFKRVMRSALAKCSQLWNNVSRSTKSSDAVERIVGVSLCTPGETRWNATYDAIKRLLEPRICDNLSTIMDALELPRFKNMELDILQEYLTVMSPIAMALDKLQGEDNCYLGFLMPTIQQVRKKLAAISPTVEHSAAMADGLIRSLETRFPQV